MTGWWLKAQGELRIAEPADNVILSSYKGCGLEEYCGFTSHAANAVMWCRGDLERIAASTKEPLVYASFTDTMFWKEP